MGAFVVCVAASVTPMDLAELTTLRLGGPARHVVEVTTERELIEAVSSADGQDERVLIVGGGSNLVVADEGFDGTVVLTRTRGISVDSDACSGAMVTVQAGEGWDDFVALAVGQDWVGIEALSGIPGLAGAVPIQNVGAYGQEVSQTIASVRTYDREANAIRTFAAADCGFAYRSSRFKAMPDRHVILSVMFQFALGDRSVPVAYAELARTLDIAVGHRAPSTDVRDAVLDLRRGKGMVLDADDHDTWSAGSFFTNPFLTGEQVARLPADAPRWEQADETVKTSAAWLIEHAGFGKGYGNHRVSLSTKHTLALTNRGGATTADLVDLAGEIQRGVFEKFGIRLAHA